MIMNESEKESLSVSDFIPLMKKTTEILELLSNGINSKLERWVKRTWIIANIVIIVQVAGVAYAVLQYNSSRAFNAIQVKNAEQYEKTKNSIEAVNKIYNSDFLNNFVKLNKYSTLNNKETRNAFNIVLNTYYMIAVVYNNHIADSLIISQSIKPGVTTFVKYPIYRDTFDISVKSAKDEINRMINNFPKDK